LNITILFFKFTNYETSRFINCETEQGSGSPQTRKTGYCNKKRFDCRLSVVQPAHALAEFQAKYPGTFKRWQKFQKNLVILAAQNESDLLALLDKAEAMRIRVVSFREPDIGNEMTAIALEPCEETYKITSSLPLALRDLR
jgi:hypothetical protein